MNRSWNIITFPRHLSQQIQVDDAFTAIKQRTYLYTLIQDGGIVYYKANITGEEMVVLKLLYPEIQFKSLDATPF